MQSGIPYPEWRSIFGYRNDQLAAQDRPRMVAGNAVPPAHARFSQRIPMKLGFAPSPQRQWRSTGTAGMFRKHPPGTAIFGDEGSRIPPDFFLFQNWPVLQILTRPAARFRRTFRPKRLVIRNLGCGSEQDVVQPLLLPLFPTLGAPCLPIKCLANKSVCATVDTPAAHIYASRSSGPRARPLWQRLVHSDHRSAHAGPEPLVVQIL